ncbi:MAG: enoyl-CoA hydratase/isomerase family protein [Deltaproteobacteria bacterium]|nr:enoyl-CoA hydratase/isomerase family protein [Deltaproteobacteria bacterium]
MIRTETHQGVARLILARPEKKNAFNGEMLQAIDRAVAAWGADPAVRVIVVQADGETFCAGADLAWMAQYADADRATNVQSARDLGGVFHRIAKAPKPVVGRIQGAARGGGVGLAAAVDIAIASDRATFALTEVRLGLLPGVISPFVVERVGPSRARQLFMTGETVSAVDAERWGLVHACVPHDDLDARVDAVVAQLVQGGPEALLACKQLVDVVAFQPSHAVFDQTAELIADRRVSTEAQEGMVAFLTRRKAGWVP